MKPGYNQTEIGVIPEDWDIGTLKEVFPRLDAGVSVNSDERAVSDYYVLKTSAVRNGKVNIREAKPVVVSDYPRLKCPVKKGSIIISRMNTPAMVGECGYSATDATDTFLPDRLWQVEPSSPDYDFQWLNYLLNTVKYSAAIRATATGTSNSMKNIAKDRLLEIAVPKPPRPEQERIAEALSDMDEMITSLEKLIAKKKAIKQGAMQELLTGKRRMPGFSRQWKTAKWKDVLSGFISGATPYRGKPEYYEGEVKWVSSGELNYIHIIDTVEHISNSAVAETCLCVHPAGTFLMAITGLEAAGTRGSCAILDVPAATNQSCMAIYSTEKMSVLYLYYYYLKYGNDLAFRYCQGTKQQSYTAAIVKELPISYPEDVLEQNAIAEYLIDLDNNIKLLEQKHLKACQIKQGMMQQLLTGKIRLM